VEKLHGAETDEKTKIHRPKHRFGTVLHQFLLNGWLINQLLMLAIENEYSAKEVGVLDGMWATGRGQCEDNVKDNVKKTGCLFVDKNDLQNVFNSKN